MQIKTITYQRVKNLGNYESERLEATAELDKNDDVHESIKQLKTQVLDSLGLIQIVPDNKDEIIDF